MMIFFVKKSTYDILNTQKWLTLLALNIPNVVVEWEVPSSSLDLETGYPKVLRGFRESLQKNAGISPKIKPRPLPSTSFSVHHSLINISYDAT
jgi:hypothetical protein